MKKERIMSEYDLSEQQVGTARARGGKTEYYVTRRIGSLDIPFTGQWVSADEFKRITGKLPPTLRNQPTPKPTPKPTPTPKPDPKQDPKQDPNPNPKPKTHKELRDELNRLFPLPTPEPAKPEPAKPEAAKPPVAKPEAAKPEAAKPEAVDSAPRERTKAEEEGLKKWASIYGPGGKKELKMPTAAQKDLFAAVKAGTLPPVRSIKKDVEELKKKNVGMGAGIGMPMGGPYDEAYDIVLDYLLSEGHVDTLDEAHYVMMQMTPEHVQEVIQERWSWNPMDWGKAEATPKNLAREKSAPGYDPKTGTTSVGIPGHSRGYRPEIMASRGGVAGSMVKGKPETWTRVNSSDPGIKAAYARYRTLRGTAQLDKDAKNNAYVSAVTKDFDRRYADVYKNPAPEREGLGPRPEAPAPKPAAKPVATTPAAPKPKPQPPTIQSKNVTATGTSYERRTPTSAELAAAKAAGGGEAGVKAAVDVAKSNKVAATTPTPDLKPEVTNKRESLVSQLDDLVKMRKAAEERNKNTN